MNDSKKMQPLSVMRDSEIPWIGTIPENWEIMPLKSIADILMGQSPPSEDVTGKGVIPFLQGNAEFGPEHPVPIHYCDVAPKRCSPGDILMSVRAPVGETNIADQQYAIGRGLCAITSKIDADFMKFALKKYSKDLLVYSNGSTFDAITMGSLSNFRIAVPPIEEQSKIASILTSECSTIDAMMIQQNHVIKALMDLKQSIISEVVTRGLDHNVTLKDSGVDWIGSVPYDWNIVPVKSRFIIQKRIAGKLGYDILSVTQEGIKIKDITSNDGQLSNDYSKYQLVYKGDFVMNHMDLLTGFVDCSEFYGVTSPDYRVFSLNTDDLLPRYALYIFQMGYKNRIFYGMGQGVSSLGRWRLPKDQFMNFLIPLPPLNVQKSIISYLDQQCGIIDSVISNYSELILKLSEFKQSLIYEYVTGKRSVSVEAS